MHKVVFRNAQGQEFESAPMDADSARGYALHKRLRGYDVSFEPPLPAPAEPKNTWLQRVRRWASN